MAKDEFDPRTAIHTPSATATYGLEALQEARSGHLLGLGLEFPVDELRDYFAPLMPGQLAAIIGQTSNGKSALLHFIEAQAARQLEMDGRSDEILIHVSVEESIEEQAILLYSRETVESSGDLSRGVIQDWSKLEQASMRIGRIPIYRIGESLARAEDMPQLYISNMIAAIDALVNGNVLDWKPKVAGIFFDYLQAFPLDPEWRSMNSDQRRRLQVRSDIYRLRQCAARFKTPVWVAVQAKQHLEGAKPPIMLPGQYDGEESSSIAQRCDRIITIWMPKTTHSVGEYVSYGGGGFIVEEDMFWIKVAKQRGRLPAGRVWPCRIDFSSNTITPSKLEIEGSEDVNDRYNNYWDERV